MSIDVDSLRPTFLREPYTLGTALSDLEGLVKESVAWVIAATAAPISDGADNHLDEALNRWFGKCQQSAERIFVSSAPKLQLISSQPDYGATPRRASLMLNHRHISRGLLNVRERLLDDRERISLATYALASRLGEHHELMKMTRDSNAMTEDLWLRVVGDPVANPPISRLLDLGLAMDVVWSIAKKLAGLG